MSLEQSKGVPGWRNLARDARGVFSRFWNSKPSDTKRLKEYEKQHPVYFEDSVVVREPDRRQALKAAQGITNSDLWLVVLAELEEARQPRNFVDLRNSMGDGIMTLINRFGSSAFSVDFFMSTCLGVEARRRLLMDNLAFNYDEICFPLADPNDQAVELMNAFYRDINHRGSTYLEDQRFEDPLTLTDLGHKKVALLNDDVRTKVIPFLHNNELLQVGHNSYDWKNEKSIECKIVNRYQPFESPS